MSNGPDTQPGGSDNEESGQDAVATPGYFPRLLSAAAHVTSLASDSALERFDLTRNRHSLLTRLARSAADETALAGSTEHPGSLPAELAALQSSGYAACSESGVWTITDAGRQVIECAKLAEAEITLGAEDSQELRSALRSLIASLGIERPEESGAPGL